MQIISKAGGKYKVIKTIGTTYQEQELQRLIYLANQEIERLSHQPKLFVSENEVMIEDVFNSLSNASIRTVGCRSGTST